MKKRDIQTAIKHRILRKYLRKWGFIITQGLSRPPSSGRQRKVRLVYIDCFAFEGRYEDIETGAQVEGSPIIGIQALDEIRQNASVKFGFTPEVITVLIEKIPKAYAALRETLADYGLRDRVKEALDIATLRDGDIVAIHGDSRGYTDRLLALTRQPSTYSFYFLDPFGPSGIPLNAVVRPIVTSAHTDAMIYFPYDDLLRKGKSAIANIEGQELHVLNYDRMFGTDAWKEHAEEYYSSAMTDEDRERMETELLHLYMEVLGELDGDLGVKEISLYFPTTVAERTLYYLMLTTRDPTGGLEMNEILDEAVLLQYTRRDLRQRQRGSATQMSLFEAGIEDPNLPAIKLLTTEEAAQLIYDRCKGQKITYKQVLKCVMNERSLYQKHVRSAMTYLRKNGMASYAGSKLANSSLIQFY